MCLFSNLMHIIYVFKLKLLNRDLRCMHTFNLLYRLFLRKKLFWILVDANLGTHVFVNRLSFEASIQISVSMSFYWGKGGGVIPKIGNYCIMKSGCQVNLLGVQSCLSWPFCLEDVYTKYFLHHCLSTIFWISKLPIDTFTLINYSTKK